VLRESKLAKAILKTSHFEVSRPVAPRARCRRFHCVYRNESICYHDRLCIDPRLCQDNIGQIQDTTGRTPTPRLVPFAATASPFVSRFQQLRACKTDCDNYLQGDRPRPATPCAIDKRSAATLSLQHVSCTFAFVMQRQHATQQLLLVGAPCAAAAHRAKMRLFAV
jgi:hypothetical protein